MIQITRGIDLSVDTTSGLLVSGPARNGQFNAIPLRLWLTYEGPCGPDTGLVVNVSQISRAVRQRIASEPVVCRQVAGLLEWCRRNLADCFAGCRLARVQADLNPSASFWLDTREQTMIYITYKYELAASHRLFNCDWAQEQNETVFGKCANPAGHGHNYVLEVTLAGTPDAATGQIVPPVRVDQTIQERIIAPFDHKNLNTDTPEFLDKVPTVENMVQVFWHRLAGQFDPARLVSVKVWETSSTYAEYRG